MAFNYPGGYLAPQAYYPQISQFSSQTPQPPSAPSSSRIWVQGELGAKSYLVALNTTVDLWDSEAPRIYIKSADASGLPSIKTLEYTVVGDDAIPPHDDLEELRGEIKALKEEIQKLKEEIE